uniref:Leucine-rich repeat and WD repeat-containing protein 1-like n=1 Tax=Phallusia mammillata TaxID=59560 RepID=A0A6F9DKP7_9ASCI|nr:leucine-rich repeat and WD repeat-containing protein 1-like [Phallusia mammillata]
MSKLEHWNGNLDEKYILAISGKENLGDIEELDLSHLSFEESDLHEDIFNKLTALIELDLSHNKLTVVPQNINIPNLQYLDISQNCIQDIDWVQRFPKLIELDIEGNTSLTIDDNYKLTYLLKDLQFIDGKRIDNREKFGNQYTQGLVLQMESLWQSLNFAELHETLNKELLVKEFTLKAKEKVKHGPNSLKGYRLWRIDQLAPEFVLFKLKCPVQNFLDFYVKSSECENMKRKIGSNDVTTSPKLQKLSAPTPDVSYNVSAILQCHSGESGSQDFSTQVWCCEFEPNKDNPTATTNIVATCGGENVCLIDCDTTKVQAKFHQPNEEFFTLAWTTMILGRHSSNILAAGGCLGFIHLIHPDQDICYGRIKIHSSPIQTMVFAPTGPTHLLSADRKSKIYLLDIDTPTVPDYKISWRKLISFEGIQATPLKLLVPDSGFHLLCATEFGLYVWKTNGFMKNYGKVIKSVCEISFPFVSPDIRVVDALAKISSGVIVSKCAQQGVIFLWDLLSLKNDISKAIQSRKAKVSVKILAELKWSVTKQCYLNLAFCEKQSQVVAGDEKGNIWLYKVENQLQNKIARCPVPESVTDPVNVIPFPSCTLNGIKIPELRNGTIYNDVSVNSDGNYIVAAADSNLLLIYKNM